MWQAKEFADLIGVSVRTLHYYDEIGLLRPGYVDEQTGYRYYDEVSLERMQQILFYRELDFPLKTILRIVSSPSYDKQKALRDQKQLLKLKKERLERLICALEETERGETINMSIFDNKELEAKREEYAKEAEARWGRTEAYAESQRKTASYGKEKWNELQEGMTDLIREFGKAMVQGIKPQDAEAQTLVQQWKDFISANYYTCTNEILAGLGQMYVADERFTKNMNREQEGTAQFMADAIRIYCEKA